MTPATTIDNLSDSLTGRPIARSIIDTIQEPLIILDADLRVIAASRSFYTKFEADPDNTRHKLFVELGNGQWNIPTLIEILKDVLLKHNIVENFEVIHTFERLGKRTMQINAREIVYRDDPKKILVSISDITERRRLELENENLAHQKDILLREMRHRIANSLQIVASILMVKARTVTSEETRSQLEEVHDRIMSIATVQGHLDPAGLDSDVEIRPYLTALCQSLAKSMIGDRRPVTITVHAGPGKVTSDDAVGLGLISTELILNTLKHAFDYDENGEVTITYESRGKSYWKLSVADNGRGMSKDTVDNRKGLGTGIIDSLTKQLHATVTTESTPNGTTISIIHDEA